jgi:hypothetical protein
MHHGYQGSQALVSDLMEQRPPQVDVAVRAFALSEDVQRGRIRDPI